MAKMGAPTKFNKVMKEKIRTLALRGFVDKEMAHLLSIDEGTLNNWKKAHPNFFKSLKEWKEIADDEVERSLFERAKGYECPETKVFYDSKALDRDTGEFGKVITHDMVKHYPPDTGAAIIWLKNRRPKEWSDSHKVELGDELSKRLAKAWTNGSK